MHAAIYKSFTIAGLALAALPIVAVSMANAQPVTVRISDLDLSRPAHVAALNVRAERAVNRLCADYRTIASVNGCEAAVRAEIADKVAQAKGGAVAIASR